MLVHQPNITEKQYRKLSVRIRPEGFTFCTTDTLNDSILTVKDIRFADSAAAINPEPFYRKAFEEHEELADSYDEIAVTHENPYNSFVPRALFDENYLGSYLQYNTKVLETDRFAYDELANYEINNVYVPFDRLNALLMERFGNFEFRHGASVLVAKLLEISKNNDDKQMFAHFANGYFDLVVVQNQKLLLYNSFACRTKEDFIYYLLFTAEQLSMNPEFFTLQLLGDITEGDDYFAVAYKYVRHVSLFDVSRLQERNTYSEADNRRHFLLFQS